MLKKIIKQRIPEATNESVCIRIEKAIRFTFFLYDFLRKAPEKIDEKSALATALTEWIKDPSYSITDSIINNTLLDAITAEIGKRIQLPPPLPTTVKEDKEQAADSDEEIKAILQQFSTPVIVTDEQDAYKIDLYKENNQQFLAFCHEIMRAMKTPTITSMSRSRSMTTADQIHGAILTRPRSLTSQDRKDSANIPANILLNPPSTPKTSLRVVTLIKEAIAQESNKTRSTSEPTGNSFTPPPKNGKVKEQHFSNTGSTTGIATQLSAPRVYIASQVQITAQKEAAEGRKQAGLKVQETDRLIAQLKKEEGSLKAELQSLKEAHQAMQKKLQPMSQDIAAEEKQELEIELKHTEIRTKALTIKLKDLQDIQKVAKEILENRQKIFCLWEDIEIAENNYPSRENELLKIEKSSSIAILNGKIIKLEETIEKIKRRPEERRQQDLKRSDLYKQIKQDEIQRFTPFQKDVTKTTEKKFTSASTYRIFKDFLIHFAETLNRNKFKAAADYVKDNVTHFQRYGSMSNAASLNPEVIEIIDEIISCARMIFIKSIEEDINNKSSNIAWEFYSCKKLTSPLSLEEKLTFALSPEEKFALALSHELKTIFDRHEPKITQNSTDLKKGIEQKKKIELEMQVAKKTTNSEEHLKNLERDMQKLEEEIQKLEHEDLQIGLKGQVLICAIVATNKQTSHAFYTPSTTLRFSCS